MKKIASIVLAAFMALIPSLLSDCDFFPRPGPNPPAERICYIGTECVFDTYSIKVDIDHLNERFVVDYKELVSDEYVSRFSFSFHPDERSDALLDREFEYTDELGTEIEFGAGGNYSFEGSKKFYVSYKNASALVKGVITSNRFSVRVGGRIFHFASNRWLSDAANVTIKIDAWNRRFIVQYEILNAEADHYLDFTFNYGNQVASYDYGKWVRNSDEFEYTDENGEPIEFGENGYYVFDTDKTIYISYANVSEEIEIAMGNHNYRLIFPFGRYYTGSLKYVT